MHHLHARALTLLLPLTLALPAAAAETTVGTLFGCHEGTVADGSDQHSITTRFDADGGGSYSFDYAGERVHGTLSQCTGTATLRLHCRWRDRFGAGDLHVQAETDGSGFRARWSTDGIDGELDWTGRRVACPAGPE